MHMCAFVQVMESGSKCTYLFVNCFLNLMLYWEHFYMLLDILLQHDFLMVPQYGCPIIYLSDSLLLGTFFLPNFLVL